MKSGFVAILGRPNAGKSTLLNALTGEKVAIVTPKPQTTRNRIAGVVEVPARKRVHPAAQIVFVDTPGVHKPTSQLDRRMLQEVHEALETRDLVLVLIDASRRVQLEAAGEPGGIPGAGVELSPLGPAGAPAKPHGKNAHSWASEEEFLFGLVRGLDCPVFLVLTKIDLVAKDVLLPLIETRRAELTEKLIARKSKAPGLSLLVPRTIEMLLDRGDVDAAVVAKLLFACSDPVSTVESMDLILERLRDHSLPRPVEEALRTELKTVLKSMIGKPNQVDEFLTVAQAYCGDQASLKQVLGWVRSNEPEKSQAARAEKEELRIRALQAILYRQVQGTVRTIVAGILAEHASHSSPEFRERVLEVLSKVDDPDVAAAVLSAYPGLSVELKAKAVNLLTHRASWTKSLLDAIASKQLPTTVLNVTQLRKLTQSNDPKILSQVKALWGTIRERRDPKRERTAASIRDMLRTTPGDPIAGEAVFKKTCALCHKIYGEGQNVGPDLTSNGRNDFDSLISNVFDPSLVIGPGYQATTLATNEGRILVGLLVEDGKDRVLLKLQGGQVETIQRSQIAEMKTSELSLMPESFETQLSQQQVADLCAYLCLDKPPSEPTARALPGSGPMIRPRK